jgi:hypothetical protein
VATGELRDALSRQGSLYHFDMTQEPVLSVTGMHRPQITYAAREENDARQKAG